MGYVAQNYTLIENLIEFSLNFGLYIYIYIETFMVFGVVSLQRFKGEK